MSQMKLRSIAEVAGDAKNDLKVVQDSPSHRCPVMPGEVCRNAILTIGVPESDLRQLLERRKRSSMNVALGVGASAYLFVQIGSYFAENPQSLYSLGSGMHAIWDNWEALTTVWEIGDFVGFDNILSAVNTTTQVTDWIFGYNMTDVLKGLADASDLASLGAGILLTIGTKALFDRLNRSEQDRLKALEAKLRQLNRLAFIAQSALPPAYLRLEIEKVGNHHFAS